METKLFESERRVLEVLWQQGDTPAKAIAAALGQQVGWGKTTTYTVIQKCIAKGVVARQEPGFVCHALLSRAEADRAETDALIDRVYGGAPDRLVANLLGSGRLTRAQLDELKKLIETLE